MLESVIFDLDGVVTDSAGYHYQAWKSLADRLGIPFDRTYNEKLKGVSRMESLNLILDRGKGRDAYTEEVKNALTEEKNQNYRKLIRTITPADMLPGIRDFLGELREADIRTGLASVSKNARYIIDRLQAGEYFDYIADAANVRQSKPYPDIFLDCLEHLHVAAGHCIGIEDAQAGIEAIHRAGMKAVGVGTPDQMQEADLILGSTADLNLNRIFSWWKSIGA